MALKQMKLIPNIITVLRMVGSVALLIAQPFSTLFFVIYFACGASDALDGMIARRFGFVSKSGQALDSIADLLFIAIVLYRVLPILKIPAWTLLWVAIIVTIRLLSLAAGFIRYRRLCFIHTCANKLSGLLLFSCPLFYAIIGLGATSVLICAAASVSGIEELLINLTSKALNRDRKSYLKDE